MKMDCGAIDHGHVYRRELDAAAVDGALVQMWVKFEDSSFHDRYILDSSITSFDVLHPARDENTPPLFGTGTVSTAGNQSM
jgi:hypothetical protein